MQRFLYNSDDYCNMIISYKYFKFNIENYSYENLIEELEFDDIIDKNEHKYSNYLLIEKFNLSELVKRIIIYNDTECIPFDSNHLIQIDENIYFCFGKNIYNINIISTNLIWKNVVDDFICIAIYKVNNGLNILVHGETQLSMINLNGEIQWTYFGSDIFLNENKKEVLKIIDNKINIIDWNDRVHVIDFKGNLLQSYKL